MNRWAYASRLRAVRGARSRAEMARMMTAALGGKTITAGMLKNWEDLGGTPRARDAVEAWIRQREPVKPQPSPRPHIGLSFVLYLDNGTLEEADNTVALMEGLIKVIRARWPKPTEPTGLIPPDGSGS